MGRRSYSGEKWRKEQARKAKRDAKAEKKREGAKEGEPGGSRGGPADRLGGDGGRTGPGAAPAGGRAPPVAAAGLQPEELRQGGHGARQGEQDDVVAHLQDVVGVRRQHLIAADHRPDQGV